MVKKPKKISSKLRKFIDKHKNIPLSTNDVGDLLDRKARMVMYSDLHLFDNISQVFRGTDAVLLFINQTDSWGHWIVLLKRPNEIEVFDSYGTPIDGQLKWTTPENRKKFHMEKPELTRLLLTAPKKTEIINNTKAFQKKTKSNNTCGRFASIRILLRKYPLADFTELFKEKLKGTGMNNDDLATVLTLLKIEENE